MIYEWHVAHLSLELEDSLVNRARFCCLKMKQKINKTKTVKKKKKNPPEDTICVWMDSCLKSQHSEILVGRRIADRLKLVGAT